MTTAEGAQVHKRTDDNEYDQPIDGNFGILAPTGKYMLTSNIRGDCLIQLIVLGAGCLALGISFSKI